MENFSAIFEHAASGLAQIGLQGNWLKVNRKLCSILGYDREELLDMTHQQVTHSDDLRVDDRYIKALLSGAHEAVSFEKRYARKNGACIWADVGISLKRNDKGSPAYFIVSICDITERKQKERCLEENEKKLAAILNNHFQFTGLLDTDGRVLVMNDAALNMLKLKRSVKEFGEGLGGVGGEEAGDFFFGG